MGIAGIRKRILKKKEIWGGGVMLTFMKQKEELELVVVSRVAETEVGNKV